MVIVEVKNIVLNIIIVIYKRVVAILLFIALIHIVEKMSLEVEDESLIKYLAFQIYNNFEGTR